MKNGKGLYPLPHLRREPADGEFHAGIERSLAVIRVFLVQLGHEFMQVFRGSPDAPAAYVGGKQHKRAGVTVYRFHQVGDLLRRAPRVRSFRF